ncbi:hypothetical protein QZM18_01160 [Burkholderia diffusa]|uniref:hypothetical protein n=1 Tax=Burkholderia diffusa TaxID=488732 RepID=UPI00264C518B|nr:hypothetical protein [Burkholderia diffusa]MDN7902734.1 hypothetical protein [Burkholderia diffusa]
MSIAEKSDELLRAAVSPELQPALRLYRRLHLSYNDLDEARATTEELLRARLPLPRRDPPSALLTALTTALVVAYARPFVNTRGESKFAERSVPGSLLRVLTSRQREVHDYLLNMRNREVAHSDADRSEIYLKLYSNGHGAIFRVALAPFRRAELKNIHRIVTKLMTEVDRRCAELRCVLPLGVWI